MLVRVFGLFLVSRHFLILFLSFSHVSFSHDPIVEGLVIFNTMKMKFFL